MTDNKGKVERPFRYIRQDFFLDRTFRNMEDLNAQFAVWLAETANARRHGTTGKVVSEAFAAERPHLAALPRIPHEAVLTEERRVSHEGMVSVGGSLYSVPDTARKRVVDVQLGVRDVRIFEDGALIALHPALEGRNQRRVDPSHRKAPPRPDQAGLKSGGAERPAPMDIVIGPRPLEFYGAVGRRMAGTEAVR